MIFHLLHLDLPPDHVLNVFIDIQTSKELIQMDADKMMHQCSIRVRTHGLDLNNVMFLHITYS